MMDDYADAELKTRKFEATEKNLHLERLKRLEKVKTSTLAEIMAMDFLPLRQVVAGLILEGFTIFAAPSKTGKTFFCYQLAAAVAQGGLFLGRLHCEKAEVLYLHLEGGPRSIKSRANMAKMPPLAGIHFAEQWAIGHEALDDLGAWLDEHKETALVIVDTIARVRKPTTTGPDYSSEYPEFSAWRELAEKRSVAIVAVTHTRKSLDEGADFVNESYGSGALSAAANGIIQIRRPRSSSNAVLKATFRDAPEIEAVLQFDGSLGQWEWTDQDPRETGQSPERTELLVALRSAANPMKAGELASVLGKTAPATSNLLKRMTQEGLVKKIKHGIYTAKDSLNTGENGELVNIECESVVDKFTNSPTSPLICADCENFKTGSCTTWEGRTQHCLDFSKEENDE